MKEEILINSQLALFFDNVIVQPDKIYQGIDNSIPELSGTPIIIPVPNEPPLYEVPIVQLKSSDGVLSLNIARNRVDFFVAGSGPEKFGIKKEKIIENDTKIFKFFSVYSKIKRIGFVTRFFIEDGDQDKTISKLIIESFKNMYKDSDTSNPTEIYLRYVEKTSINGVDVNNYTSLEKFSAKIPSKGEDIRGILITRDFNTVPTQNYSNLIDADFLKKFIEIGIEKFRIDELKNILWPKEK